MPDSAIPWHFFFYFTLLWPCHFFSCAAVVSNDYSKQPGRATLSLRSQLWEGHGSGVSSCPQVKSLHQTWNTAKACDSCWIPGCPTADVSCFWPCSLFLKAILSGQIENNWLECNILQEKKKEKKLAFAVCLRAWQCFHQSTRHQRCPETPVQLSCFWLFVL